MTGGRHIKAPDRLWNVNVVGVVIILGIIVATLGALTIFVIMSIV